MLVPTVFNQVTRILLFSPAFLHSQKKPQKVSLLFEDEDDDFNGGLFGAKSVASTSPASPQANVSGLSLQQFGATTVLKDFIGSLVSLE